MAALVPLAPEIVWWTPSDVYLENPDAFREYLYLWKESGKDNLVGTFFGSQLGNSYSRVWVTVWKSLEHHHAFMQEESYADLGLSLMEAMSGPNIINQALITSSFSSLERALSAPVTQFIYITTRPLHDRGYELVPLIAKLQTELKKIPCCVASCWGPSTEKERLLVGIVGWTNLEDKDRAVNGPLSDIVRSIRELSNVELKLASLSPLQANDIHLFDIL